MYSPKIREDLIPALYLHSKDLGEPMTGVANRYIVQGFASDFLSDTVKLKLPRSYEAHLKSSGLEQIVESTPQISNESYLKGASPFGSVDEIMTWYERSQKGVQSAALEAKLGEYSSSSVKGRLQGHDWLFKTIQLNLNRGLAAALVNYSIRGKQVPSDTH